MKILVVGAGYVGLVTAACLSSGENTVVCVDTDPSKIARLRQGVIPIYEPGAGGNPTFVQTESREGGLQRGRLTMWEQRGLPWCVGVAARFLSAARRTIVGDQFGEQ